MVKGKFWLFSRDFPKVIVNVFKIILFLKLELESQSMKVFFNYRMS